MSEEAELQNEKFSFITKEPIKCPVCEASFKREEMLTGRGRLIAGKLTLELRRLYEPSKKFGDRIKPLSYPVTVCPECYFAAYKEDFQLIDKKLIDTARQNGEKRKANVQRIFGGLDFNQERTLAHGAASCFLAVEGYSYFDKRYAPTFKKAVLSLRAAWLFGDLELEQPDKTQYGDLQNFFYKKALFFYRETMDRWQKGQESYDSIRHFGPDTDKNFGYEGVLYLVAYLTNKQAVFETDMVKKKAELETAKRTVSKMFGSGKASKDKPSAILDMTRDLYEEMTEEVKRIEEELAAKPVDGAAQPSGTAQTTDAGT
jgi:uncharacterized protein (DUF2225 family)